MSNIAPPASALPLTCPKDIPTLNQLGALLWGVPFVAGLFLASYVYGVGIMALYRSAAFFWAALVVKLVYALYGRLSALVLRRHALNHVEVAGEPLRFAAHLRHLWIALHQAAWLHLALKVAAGILSSAGMPKISSILGLGCSWLAAGFADFYGTRYRLQQTSLRGDSFDLLGSFRVYARVYWRYTLVAWLSLGLKYPEFAVHTRRALYAGVRWRGHAMHYAGDAWHARGLYLQGAALTVVTLGIYLPWHLANLTNYHRSALSLGGVSCRCFQDGNSLAWLWFGNSVILLATLGFGSGYVTARTLRYQLAHMELVGEIPARLAGPDAAAQEPAPRAGGLSDALSNAAFYA